MPGKRTAMKGKRTLDHILRLMNQHGMSVERVAERYDREPHAIIMYLRERGYDSYGHRMKKPRKPNAGQLKQSAGGSAGYVAASNHDEACIPLQPVRYTHRERKVTKIDWGSPSEPVCNCGAFTDGAFKLKHKQGCPAWTVADLPDSERISPAEKRPPGKHDRRRKFTDEQCMEIRLAYEDGQSAPQLGKRYDVSYQTIMNAVRHAGGQSRGQRRYSKRQHTHAFEEAS